MTEDSEKGDTLPERGEIIDIAQIVRQLEDLVKLSLECEVKDLRTDVSFVEVNKKLISIQKEILRFQENYKRHLAMLNLKPDDVKPSPEEIAGLGPKERVILEKMQLLQSSCEDARDRMYQQMQADQETLKAVKGELKDKSKEKFHRKGKFKGVGGKQGWIPS